MLLFWVVPRAESSLSLPAPGMLPFFYLFGVGAWLVRRNCFGRIGDLRPSLRFFCSIFMISP